MTETSKTVTAKRYKKRHSTSDTSHLKATASSAPASDGTTEHQVEAATELVKQPGIRNLSLQVFVEEAWHILEPVSTLVWNWHLDLICEYLTLIKDGQFKNACGDFEGIIFNVPP
jgi:hypothetical protein